MQKTFRCVDHYGNWHEIPAEKFQWRVSVYGILRKEDGLVLVQEKWKKRWEFPGGGIEMGENLETTLKREFLEETGLEISARKFHSFVESWFYAEDRDIAWHGFLFYYFVTKQGGVMRDTVTGQDVEKVAIVDPKTLTEENTEPNTFTLLKTI